MDDVSKMKKGMNCLVTKPGTTKGMIVKQEYIDRREVGKEVVVLDYVPGHGGDVWFVKQDNGIAVYTFSELDVAK
jgi:hypothetical protein